MFSLSHYKELITSRHTEWERGSAADDIAAFYTAIENGEVNKARDLIAVPEMFNFAVAEAAGGNAIIPVVTGFITDYIKSIGEDVTKRRLILTSPEMQLQHAYIIEYLRKNGNEYAAKCLEELEEFGEVEASFLGKLAKVAASVGVTDAREGTGGEMDASVIDFSNLAGAINRDDLGAAHTLLVNNTYLFRRFRPVSDNNKLIFNFHVERYVEGLHRMMLGDVTNPETLERCKAILLYLKRTDHPKKALLETMLREYPTVLCFIKEIERGATAEPILPGYQGGATAGLGSAASVSASARAKLKPFS